MAESDIGADGGRLPGEAGLAAGGRLPGEAGLAAGGRLPDEGGLAAGDRYPFDSVPAYPAADIAADWRRERPGVPVSSIEIVTPIWRLAKLLADDRRRVLQACGVDPATLDLLGVLRRSGPPYRLTTREIARRALVTAGAVSQRVSRAEREGLVERTAASDGSRSVIVSLTAAGHARVEGAVDQVLGREAQLMSGLPPQERAVLAGLLDRLLQDVTRAAAARPGLADSAGAAEGAGRVAPGADHAPKTAPKT